MDQNFFDQFDQSAQTQAPPANFFDQFHAPEIPETAVSPEQMAAYAKSVQKPSLGEKFLMGAGDVLNGLTQLNAHYGAPTIPGVVMPDLRTPDEANSQSAKIDQDIAQREGAWQGRRKASGDTGVEWMRGTGAATVAAPLAAMLPEVGGPAWLAPFANGAIQGAGAALATPVTDTRGGYGSAKLGQVGSGALFGGLTNVGTNMVSRAISPEVDPAVQYLRDRGVQPTVGQNIGPNMASAEDRFSSVNPFVTMGQKRAIKQFNVAAYNEALAPIAEVTGQDIKYSGPAGREGVKAVGDMLSDRFNALKSSVSLPVDDTLKAKLNQVEQQLAVEAPPMAERLKTFIDNRLYNRVDGNGVLTGDAFKSVESAFTDQAGRYSKSLDGDQRAYAEALHNVSDALREHLAASNPSKAAELGALNKGWAILARIEDAVPTGSHEGIFTPYQIARSAETADNSVRHRAYVRGEALLQPLTDAGLKVLGNRYPDSGTAGRVAAGSVVLGGVGAVNPIMAAALGSSSLAYTPAGQRFLGAILNDRPAVAGPVAGAVRRAGPLLTTGATFGLLQPSE